MDYREAVDDSGSASRAANEAALRRLRRFAVFMDSAVPIPGTQWRIGADALIGLVPGVGDGITGLMSLYLVAEAARLGVGKTTLARMLANLAVDAAVGTVPVLGDVFDVGFKANRRNLTLLERRLRERMKA